MTKFLRLVLTGALTTAVAGCGAGGTSEASLWDSPSQPPDKRLFDLATDNFAAGRYVQALSLFETLVNAYPDSHYVERAKLALDECDRTEPCASIRPQVKNCTAVCVTFFPSMSDEKDE